MMLIPAIVLSSHTTGLGVTRALGSNGVPVIVVYYEKYDMGYVSKYVKEAISAPHPTKHQDEFVGIVIECASRFGRSLLIPADDATLEVVSRYKSLLENYHIVACTEWKLAEQYIDKSQTYALAEAIGVPCPKTLIPMWVDDVKQYGTKIDFPCLIKPCKSHHYFEVFGKKICRVENMNELVCAYEEATDAGIQVMVQELVPGDDTQGVNYNSYFWNGQPLLEVTAQKVRLTAEGFGVPRVVLSKEIPEVIEPGRKILQAMGYYGYSCMEFKWDVREGVYKLMEVNGRHNRSTLLAARCGINFPLIEYKHLTQGELPAKRTYRTGIYWIDEVRDVIQGAQYCYKEEFSLLQFVRPYLKPHIFAVFDVKDLKPFVKRCTDLIKMGVQSILTLFSNDSEKKRVDQ